MLAGSKNTRLYRGIPAVKGKECKFYYSNFDAQAENILTRRVVLQNASNNKTRARHQ